MPLQHMQHRLTEPLHPATFAPTANSTVIGFHHNWLRCAGVDFIVIDWSNNINCAGSYDRGSLRPACPQDNAINQLEQNTQRVSQQTSALVAALIALACQFFLPCARL